MVFSQLEIIPAIRGGQCRRVDIPGFSHDCYFADTAGNVYSLSNPREPKALDRKLGTGLMWVTLYEKNEGVIRRVMVGDIIAYTFMNDVPHQEDESTVVYIDGDVQNNALENLRWGTPQQQQQQLRALHTESSSKEPKVERGKAGLAGPSTEESANATVPPIPFAPKNEQDPLLDKLHALQFRVEEAERRETVLANALSAFACFQLSPALAIDLGTAVVLESNKGSNKHSKLTVQDFRLAKQAISGEREHGSKAFGGRDG